MHAVHGPAQAPDGDERRDRVRSLLRLDVHRQLAQGKERVSFVQETSRPQQGDTNVSRRCGVLQSLSELTSPLRCDLSLPSSYNI